MKFRKKAVVIEAILLSWATWNEVCNFVSDEAFGGGVHLDDTTLEELPEGRTSNTLGLKINTLEGVMLARQGDYIIKGVNGEFYPCKPDIFEKTYDAADSGMTFGTALEALKEGKKVARSGWNGKGMWIVMMPSLYLPPHSTQEPGAKVNDRTAKHIGVDTPLDSQPYFAMWTAAGQWQPGWNASTPDLLAEDWGVVD